MASKSSATSVINIKTAGHTCPNLRRFAAQVHPFFYFYSCGWANRMGLTAHDKKRHQSFSPVVAVSSPIFRRSILFAINNGRSPSHANN